MKYFICSLLFLVVLGCVTEDNSRIEREYAIENSSNFDIKIDFFQADQNTFLESIFLSVGQQTNFEIKEGNRGFLNNENSPLSVWPSGNAEIIFNNESILTVISSNGNQDFSQPINRNIFRIGNYESIGDRQYLFTITDEDYNNATPCDGPCE